MPVRRSTPVRQLLEAAPLGESLSGFAGAAISRAGALRSRRAQGWTQPACCSCSWFEAGLASLEVHRRPDPKRQET